LEGNTISPEAAEELAKVLVKHSEFERFIGNDIFTGRLKDEIPLSLVKDNYLGKIFIIL
jgi:Ran GTPase-activating protein (RanGAP) involved in mRNA processing and transport